MGRLVLAMWTLVTNSCLSSSSVSIQHYCSIQFMFIYLSNSNGSKYILWRKWRTVFWRCILVVYMCAAVQAHTWHGVHVEGREWFIGVSSLLFCLSWELNSGQYWAAGTLTHRVIQLACWETFDKASASVPVPDLFRRKQWFSITGANREGAETTGDRGFIWSNSLSWRQRRRKLLGRSDTIEPFLANKTDWWLSCNLTTNNWFSVWFQRFWCVCLCIHVCWELISGPQEWAISLINS